MRSVSGIRSWLIFMVKRFAVALRIIDRDLNFHVPDIATVKPLGDVQRVGMGVASCIQPGSIVEAARVY
jgi:hypothetical protein